MKLNNKLPKQSKKVAVDNDFASGFEDSKFDKFKPALKVLVVIILLMSVVWGLSAYFGSTDEKNDANKNYTSNTTQVDDDTDTKFLQCIDDMSSKSPIPEADDTNFYPKLIAYYDAQIDCHDRYPSASGATSRSSLEYQRDNALDSSGSYKDTYLSSGGSGGSSSRKDPVTGCDYSLSESEYLKCTDKHRSSYSTHSESSGEQSTPSSTPPPSQSSSPPPPTPTSPPSNSGGSSGSVDPYVALNACLAEANNMPTEASRARARQGCYQDHTP